jgi:hypothetical protein
LLKPYAYETAAVACLIFPAVGMAIDKRRIGRVHPAWWWIAGVIVAMVIFGNLITHSPLGDSLYHAATAGSPGASIAPLEYPPPPPGTLMTGR